MSQQPQRVHYIHRLSYTARERLVGTFTLLAIAVVIALVIVNSKASHIFKQTVEFHAYFNDAQGVAPDTLIRVSGIEVGRVASVGLDERNRVHVVIAVEERHRSVVRTDSQASLGSLSLLGKPSIQISAGSPEAPLLPDGATIATKEPKSLDEILQELDPVLESLKITIEGVSEIVTAMQPERMEQTLAELDVAAHNFRVLSDRMVAGEGPLGKLIVSPEVEQAILDVAAIIADFRQVTHSLAAGEGAAGLALNDEAFRQDVASTLTATANTIGATADMTEQLRAALPTLLQDTATLLEQLNTAAGSANVELQALPELMVRVRALLTSVDRILEGTERIWPLSKAIDKDTEPRLVPPTGE